MEYPITVRQMAQDAFGLEDPPEWNTRPLVIAYPWIRRHHPETKISGEFRTPEKVHREFVAYVRGRGLHKTF